MAAVVLNQTIFYGDKKLITHYNNVSDNSGGTTTIVDVSALGTSPSGDTCTRVRLTKLWYGVSMTAKVASLRLLWDATTDATILTL